ncbi:winged helix-turn-helix domain-containing protein [Virgisporangium ochraceum]|uniref:Transcriptional regulator n=1 Tax=Virgisporangium ochraceum TaxID=65505 RepID=A0A8J4EFX7_9ACTN|nr:ArsR family transcriptional regulator [Virgisporangium ochraceum]GIJ74125.1 transcriptional regulator [Virgisporangium ochraceum]
MYCQVVKASTYGEVLARFGGALSAPTSVQVLLALRDGPGDPAELAGRLGLSPRDLADCLACLRGCGLVVLVPEGRRARYELVDTRLGHALDDLLGVVPAADPGCSTSPDGDVR